MSKSKKQIRGTIYRANRDRRTASKEKQYFDASRWMWNFLLSKDTVRKTDEEIKETEERFKTNKKTIKPHHYYKQSQTYNEKNSKGSVMNEPYVRFCRELNTNPDWAWIKELNKNPFTYTKLIYHRTWKQVSNKNNPTARPPTRMKVGEEWIMTNSWKFIGRNKISVNGIGVYTLRGSDLYEKFKHVKTITIHKKNGKVYISIGRLVPQEEREEKMLVGIDINAKESSAIAWYAEDETNNIYSFPDSVNKLYERKKQWQKVAARRYKRGKPVSNRWRKVMKIIANNDFKTTAIKKNWRHNITHQLTERYTPVLESLKTKNMTKSAKGDVENPGKNVKQKSGLNRKMLQVAPYEFKRQFSYKSPELIKIDPKYTSQDCSECGKRMKDKERWIKNKKNSWFSCEFCPYEGEDYYNSARNILNKGLDKKKKK